VFTIEKTETNISWK